MFHVASLVTASSGSTPLPEAKTILDRNAAAMGGEAAFAPLMNRLVTGTVTRNNGRVAPACSRFELHQSKPQTARLSTDLSHPPEADAELLASFVKPMLLRTVYREPRVIARDRIRERDVVVISATAGTGATHRLWFDASTHLLLRRSDEVVTPLGNLPQHYDFDDYRRVDGVMVPFTLQWSRVDYQTTFVVAEVRHNVVDTPRPVTNGDRPREAGQGMPAARVDLGRELRRIAASAPGTLGVRVVHLETGAAEGLNDQDWYPMMSAYKLPIAIHALRQAERHVLDLNRTVTLGSDDRRPGFSPLARMIDRAISRLAVFQPPTLFGKPMPSSQLFLPEHRR
jgi:hypothetical protein